MASSSLPLLFLAAAFLMIPAMASSSPPDEEKAIFLLAGQSNMAGRGGTYNPTKRWDGDTPPLCRPSPNILRLNKIYAWEEASEPLHADIPFAPCPGTDPPPGVGPGMPFANALIKRSPGPAYKKIGLVPCAVGATSIGDWGRGGCLYARLLTRARAALSAGGTLRGMLWYQGENDAAEPSVDTYEEKLRTFFNDVRSDLMSPTLPIVQVALASPNITSPAGRKIRRIQLHLKLQNVTAVDAKGLPLDGSGLHLTTAAQVRLGRKMEHAFVTYFI